MPKFTFKKHAPTGRYRSFDTEYHDIKLNKKIVGTINEYSNLRKRSLKHLGPNDNFYISFRIIDEDEQCGWRNCTLTKKFQTAIEAREFLNQHITKILERFKFHYQ